MSDTADLKRLTPPPDADIDPDLFKAAFSRYRQRIPGLSLAQLDWIATAMSDRRLADNELAQHLAAFVAIAAGPNLDNFAEVEALHDGINVLLAVIQQIQAEADGALH